MWKGVRKITAPGQERDRKISAVQEVPGGLLRVTGDIQEGQVQWDEKTLDQARVLEVPKKFASQGGKRYSTPLCSSDMYLTTSI